MVKLFGSWQEVSGSKKQMKQHHISFITRISDETMKAALLKKLVDKTITYREFKEEFQK